MNYSPAYFKFEDGSKTWREINFVLDATDYDPRLAWWLAQCSELSYENKITIAAELKKVGFEQLFFFDNNGTQAFLTVHPGWGKGNFAILAFRGTERDSIDIFTDINLVRRLFPSEQLQANLKQSDPPPQLYAHGGFFQGVLNVWGSTLTRETETVFPNATWIGSPGISEAISELPPEIPLYVTGHSLGGALATLAAYKVFIYQSGANLAQVYTFGSPRTVQSHLAELIDQDLEGKIYRVVNGYDIVARIPPRIPIILSYHHVDKLIFFTRKKEHIEQFFAQVLFSTIGILILAFLEFLVSIITFKLYTPQTLKDHRIAEYIQDLEREIQQIYD